jgi:hypothetical protein
MSTSALDRTGCASYHRVAQFGKIECGWQAVREVSMRLPILSLFVIAAALLVEMPAASAQSPYSYPWCSRQAGRDFDTTSCYFTSYQQCMTTISGIGGWCYQSPYYHAASAPRQQAVKSRRLRHQ